MISRLLIYKFTVGMDRRICCQLKVCNKDINILTFSWTLRHIGLNHLEIIDKIIKYVRNDMSYTNIQLVWFATITNTHYYLQFTISWYLNNC